MEFSRQEYWSGLPCPSPGDHPNPLIELASLALEADRGEREEGPTATTPHDNQDLEATWASLVAQTTMEET